MRRERRRVVCGIAGCLGGSEIRQPSMKLMGPNGGAEVRERSVGATWYAVAGKALMEDAAAALGCSDRA